MSDMPFDFQANFEGFSSKSFIPTCVSATINILCSGKVTEDLNVLDIYFLLETLLLWSQDDMIWFGEETGQRGILKLLGLPADTSILQIRQLHHQARQNLPTGAW